MTNHLIFSGMQPTGSLHLGNYLGALKNWVALQQHFSCIYCIVDLHALTIPPNPTELTQAIRTAAAAYMAAGVDPKQHIIFPQSAVSGHAELGWVLSCFTPLGWLERMTQFKDKAKSGREAAGLGLYSYPVLMSADILLYRATHVPVGEDQKQHLELARDVAGAFNRHYGVDFFPLPEPQILGEATRVMSLRDGTKKMSKSDESDYSRINLTDDAETIALKIRKAKTDAAPLPDSVAELGTRPEADNLVTIYAALLDISKEQALRDVAGQNFSTFKQRLTEVVVEKIAPMTARMRHYLADVAEIDRQLNEGAARARAMAEATMKEAAAITGLWR